LQACQLNPLIRGIGIEYDQEIYLRACELIRSHNLCEPQVSAFNSTIRVYILYADKNTQRKYAPQVRIVHDNVLNIDFSDATCVFVYLVPEGMKLLQPALVEALRRGVRIVTYGKCCRSSCAVPFYTYFLERKNS